MDINYNVPLNKASKNFTKVINLVEKNGVAVILKNDKPKYVVIDAAEYNLLSVANQKRKEKLDVLSDILIENNKEALTELAK